MKALLFSIAAFLALGALTLLYMTDVGVNVMLAIIEAVTPPNG
jgi:hypothetical protein